MTTWGQLVKTEPQLLELEREALEAHREEMDWPAWSRIKGRLVGWGSSRPEPELRSGESWKVCFDYLLFCFEKGERPDQAKPRTPRRTTRRRKKSAPDAQTWMTNHPMSFRDAETVEAMERPDSPQPEPSSSRVEGPLRVARTT